MVNKSRKAVYIYMNGFDVGRLERTNSGLLQFNYSSSWLNTPDARPISLSLPLLDKMYSGEKVYNFFDNLLPDNPSLRQRIQTRFKLTSDHPFDLLVAIGRDCIGAIQIMEEENFSFEKKIKFKPIKETQLAYRLKNLYSSTSMSDDIDDFRISLAGVQEKYAFLYHNKKWCIPLEDTPTTHIFKLPIGIIPHQQIDLNNSCENEWLCLKIAAAFGFDTAKSEILNFNDVKALVVERFDRVLSADKTWIMRLPQEDMCQALGISPNTKYQSDGGPGIKDILDRLLAASNATYARDTFFKTQILFWLLGAIDGHAKNFSIFIKPRGSFELTPLYDIISAFPIISSNQLSEKKIKMAMALRGKNIHYKWSEGTHSRFLNTAKYCNYSVRVAENLLEEMLFRVDYVIDNVIKILPINFNEELASAIFKGMVVMRERLKKSK